MSAALEEGTIFASKIKFFKILSGGFVPKHHSAVQVYLSMPSRQTLLGGGVRACRRGTQAARRLQYTSTSHTGKVILD